MSIRALTLASEARGSRATQVLARVYGEKEAGKILQAEADVLVGLDTSIMALRPDLSRQ